MNEKKLEIRVGIFVLTGLLAIGVLAVTFGRFGEMFNRDYEITVVFPNASGIIKNAQVLYRGAKVGKVSERPAIIDRGAAVELTLRINADIQIPSNSEFRIGSYGLLGDRFVDIVTPAVPATTYLRPGERVEKIQQEDKGFSDIAREAQPIIKRLDDISAKIDQQLMNPEALQNWQDTLANARSISARVDAFMAQVEKGQGTISLLVNDKQTAADLQQAIRQIRDLSYNLKRHGVLFYSDSAEKDAAKEAAKNVPKKK